MLCDDGDDRSGSNSGGDDRAVAAAVLLSEEWDYLPRVSFPRHMTVPLEGIAFTSSPFSAVFLINFRIIHPLQHNNDNLLRARHCFRHFIVIS